MLTYLVEAEDDFHQPYGHGHDEDRSAAEAEARRLSDPKRCGLAYVVAIKRGVRCGQRVFASGRIDRTEGEYLALGHFSV